MLLQWFENIKIHKLHFTFVKFLIKYFCDLCTRGWSLHRKAFMFTQRITYSELKWPGKLFWHHLDILQHFGRFSHYYCYFEFNMRFYWFFQRLTVLTVRMHCEPLNNIRLLKVMAAFNYYHSCVNVFVLCWFFLFVFSRAVSTSGATYLVTMACVCPVVCISQSDPPPGNHQISKIPKPKFVSAHSEQLFRGGGRPPPVKGKIFDTRFGLIHVQTGKKFLAHFFF